MVAVHKYKETISMNRSINIPDPIVKFYEKYKSQEFYLMELLHQSGSLIRIHQLNEAKIINIEYRFDQVLPNWFALGDDGGDELVCYHEESGEIALIPISPADEKHAMWVDKSLDDLLHHSTRLI